MSRRRSNKDQAHKRLRKRLLAHLSKPHTLEELAVTIGVTQRDVSAEIKRRKNQGYVINKEGAHYFLQTTSEANTKLIDIPNNSTFAVLGDTHLASKHECLDELHDFYDWAADEGAEFFVHAGDLIQGIGVFKGEATELKYFTMEDQLRHFIDNYPEFDVPTYAIFGNHDLKQFESGKSPHPRHTIESERDDLIFVGDYSGRLRGRNTDITIDLLHPAGGASYARSYKPQKFIEQMPPGEEPHILAWGHHHDALYLPYRGVNVFKVASFQGHSSFAKRLGLPSIVGAWLVNVQHDGKDIDSITPRFKEYKSG